MGREQHITVPGADQSDDADETTGAAAERVQTLLRERAEEELLPMRMLQCERKAVGLGDGVYRVLGPGEEPGAAQDVRPRVLLPRPR